MRWSQAPVLGHTSVDLFQQNLSLSASSFEGTRTSRRRGRMHPIKNAPSPSKTALCWPLSQILGTGSQAAVAQPITVLYGPFRRATRGCDWGLMVAAGWFCSVRPRDLPLCSSPSPAFTSRVCRSHWPGERIPRAVHAPKRVHHVPGASTPVSKGTDCPAARAASRFFDPPRMDGAHTRPAVRAPPTRAAATAAAPPSTTQSGGALGGPLPRGALLWSPRRVHGWWAVGPLSSPRCSCRRPLLFGRH